MKIFRIILFLGLISASYINALTPVRDECKSGLVYSATLNRHNYISISPKNHWVVEAECFPDSFMCDSVRLSIFQYCYPQEKIPLSTFYALSKRSLFLSISGSWGNYPIFFYNTWSPDEDTVFFCMRGSSINTLRDTDEVFMIDVSSITTGNIKSTHQSGVSPKILKTSNHPNPFNNSLTIEYSIPSDGYVAINIYDSKGALVKVLGQEKQKQGPHSLQWNGKDNYGMQLSGGIYYYQVISGDNIASKKIVKLE
jgi:hypothetical protein